MVTTHPLVANVTKKLGSERVNTNFHLIWHRFQVIADYTVFQKQDAQLSQRDRAAGCVIVFAKSRRLELGDNILRTLYVYLQPL